MNYKELCDKILDLTRDGPLCEWVERIGQIASKAGLPLEQINWNNSPMIVSWEVIQNAKSYYGNTNKLEEVLR